MMPFPTIWAVLFFVMLLLLGLDSQVTAAATSGLKRLLATLASTFHLCFPSVCGGGRTNHIIGGSVSILPKEGLPQRGFHRYHLLHQLPDWTRHGYQGNGAIKVKGGRSRRAGRPPANTNGCSHCCCWRRRSMFPAGRGGRWPRSGSKSGTAAFRRY